MWTPPVSRYMTPHPRVLSPDDKLSAVRILMHEHQVHHLPVVEDQILVGILSDRDLVLMNTFEDRVRDAMTRDVASVTKETPLDEVVTLMAARHFGSVVVVGKAGVEGIFTVHDALRALHDVLQREEESDR